MAKKKLLFISILGEPSHYNPKEFRNLCPSGLEKDWILNWHGNLSGEYGFELTCIDICRNDILPLPEDVHSVIVGGSAHLIDEQRGWLDDLMLWLVEYRALNRPFLGICGGHQLVSTKIFNGQFVKRKSGTLAGTFEIELTDAGRKSPLFRGLQAKPRFHFANFLHVSPSVEMMDSVLARHSESQAIAIDHGGNWYSVQFHPEATKLMLTCYGKKDKQMDLDTYSENHDGPQLFKNFLSIAEDYYKSRDVLLEEPCCR